MWPKVGLWWGDGLFGSRRDDQIGAKNTESDGLLSQGDRTPHPRMNVPSSSRFPRASLLLFLFPPLPFGRSLLVYISFSFVHPPPTLVSHPCLYLSARPIGHSFWHSVSCCGSYCNIQGSHPHKWGQGVSCGYLIRRWQLLLGLLFYHAPMADPLGSKSPLGSSRGLLLVMWRLPLLWFWSTENRVILGSISWQFGFPSFVLEHFFLLSMGLGLDMKWVGLCQILQPHKWLIIFISLVISYNIKIKFKIYFKKSLTHIIIVSRK